MGALHIVILVAVLAYFAALVAARRKWSRGTLAVVTVRPYLALSHDALVRGDIAKADGFLDAIPPQSEASATRLIALARAELAVAKGRAAATDAERETFAKAAIEACTTAIGTPSPPSGTTKRGTWLSSAIDGVTAASAQALRALVHADRGLAAEARADAEQALASSWAAPSAIARARLAQAMAMTDRGFGGGAPEDRARADHLAEHGAVIRNAGTLGERAMLRRLDDRNARERGAYRVASRIELDPARIALWESTREKRGRAATQSASAAREKVSNARGHAVRSARRREGMRVARFMALLVAVPAALLFSPDDMRAGVGIGLAALFAVLLPLGLANVVRKFLRDEATILASRRAESIGDGVEATKRIEPLATHASPALRARVRHVRALIACAQHEHREALSECDAGLAELAIAAQARGVTQEGVHPELLAERAYVLAALGRRAEAEQELATLEQSFLGWNDRTTKIFRVQLALAVVARDLPKAIELARSRKPDMRLPPVDDAVADLILAASGMLDVPSMQRLEEEIARDDVLANGIEAVAPNLVASIFGDRGAAQVRVAVQPDVKIDDSPPESSEEPAEAAPTLRRREARRS